MAGNVGGAGTATNRNDGPAFRAIVEDERGERRSILVLGFTGTRELFVRQLEASENARPIACVEATFRSLS